MRIGLCSSDFRRAYPACGLFARIKNMGFECVQLGLETVAECRFSSGAHVEIPPEITDEAIVAIRAASLETGLPVIAVNGTWNMAHPDENVRKEAIRRFDILTRAVHALDCPVITLCTGTRSPEGLWRPSDANTTEQAWRDMSESMRAILPMAEREGITLAIETEASNVIRTPEKAQRILREMQSTRLAMILDAANLFLPGEARPENVRPRLDEALRCFGDAIVLAHGKDIRSGDGIDFCATGKGIIDFPYMLRLLREAGYRGDLLLHGIYDENDMPRALAYARACLKEIGE